MRLTSDASPAESGFGMTPTAAATSKNRDVSVCAGKFYLPELRGRLDEGYAYFFFRGVLLAYVDYLAFLEFA
jgi:hypothetical protein